MNGSGNFPNDFIGASVRCGAMGVKVAVVGGGSTYTPELVEGFVTRGDRLPVDQLVLLDIDPERLAIVGALAERMMRKAGWEGELVLTGDREPRARRGRLRHRAAARGRPGRPLQGRDHPAEVRLHRPGDDRSGRLREGAADRTGGPGARRGDRTPGRAGRVVRGLHQPHRARDAGAAGPRPSRDRPVQRGDRVPASVRATFRRGARARATGARGAQPPDVGAQGAGGRRGPARARSWTPPSTWWPRRRICPRS